MAIREPLQAAASSADVTLLFSDIEGSTARWKMYPDAMPAHLRKHDDLVRAAIERHRGAVFKTVGDEFCAVFTDAADALAAAADAQRALCAEDWSAVGGLRVRMAVHRGPASMRDGDYFGTTVNRVARLLSAGHGGQILVSAQAASAIAQEPGHGSSLIDLGRHRLKDFPELESVYQLAAPELPDVFPPLRTVAERPTNLPQYLPSLIGRETDAKDVVERLKYNRLVSLIGAGGVGKTALAVQIGTSCLSQFEDGAWLVELAPVDADAVVPSIAAAFGITVSGGGALMDALAEHLKNKNLLLIIDNCEHVSAAAVHAIDTILKCCGGVRVLATSREPLSVQGEIVYRLPVLAVPWQSVRKAEEVRTYGACRLFEERARAHVAGFEITDENAPLVASICRRLDGIALAIELAAPRLRMMTLAQLSDRLTERFRLLTGGSRTALPHHQTMRALIDWSYQLLCENERVLLRRSALFPGGWTIGAAVDICTDDSLEEWDILDHLTSLVDKSLIVADQTGNEQRYHLLESTREYAFERLQESGERDIVSLKQAQYFLRLAEHADAAWLDVPAKVWIAPLDDELDNFRAALSWCATQQHAPLLGLRLFEALEAFWWDAQPVEGRRWLEHFEPLAESAPSAQRARYWLTAAGIALSTAQEKTALSAADKALAAYQHVADDAGIAAAQRCRGAALIRLGKLDEGEAAVRCALDLFRGHGHLRLTALALRTLAAAQLLHGDVDTAAQVYREALPLSQALEDERGAQIISGNLAEIEALGEHYEQALMHGREALEIARSRRDWVMVCTLLINVTAYLLALDRFSEARLAAREALSIAGELRSEIHLAVAIQHLAAVAAHCGDPERSARLIGYVDTAYARLENSREPNEAREYERTISQLGERLPAFELQAQCSAGAVLSADQAQREALLT